VTAPSPQGNVCLFHGAQLLPIEIVPTLCVGMPLWTLCVCS